MGDQGRLSVLQLSAADNAGGAARSAYRLHVGLRRAGVRSQMVVGVKVTDDPDVLLVSGSLLRGMDRVAQGLGQLLSLQYLFCPSSWLLPLRRALRQADIIQLNNIHGSCFSHLVLPLLSSARPVLWWLHDMWPFTGHCTYSYGCERWRAGCGSCPILGDYPRLRRDTTAMLWRIKQRVYAASSMTIVAPSRWMAKLAAQSPLFAGFPIRVIPYGVDVKLYCPEPKSAARRALGLSGTGSVLLYSAHSLADRRKGYELFREAVCRLQAAGLCDVIVLVAGGHDDAARDLPVSTRRLGHVDDERTMARAYSAADLFVLPTLADNLPNAILESLACGTPVVAFDVGGVGEVVRHLETGYLVSGATVDGLAAGVHALVADPDLRARLGRQGRDMVEREFSLSCLTSRFHDLYCEVLGAGGRSDREWPRRVLAGR